MVPKILLVKAETKGSREGSDFRGLDQEGQELMGVKVQAGETLKTQEFQTYRVLANGVGVRRLQRNTVDLDQKLSLSLLFKAQLAHGLGPGQWVKQSRLMYYPAKLNSATLRSCCI